VESNARITAGLGAVLLVLLAAEGVTILRIRALLDWHIFLGIAVIPVVLAKLGSTSWRFARYYAGYPAYRRKGPPRPLLRLLGPLVVVLTVVLLASGVALILVPREAARPVLLLHQASFVAWFAAMTVHVLGHLAETARLAPLDWFRRTRRDVAGAGARIWVLCGSLGAGLVLGALAWGHTGAFSHFGHLGR
jgi:hypothetical protein